MEREVKAREDSNVIKERLVTAVEHLNENVMLISNQLKDVFNHKKKKIHIIL